MIKVSDEINAALRGNLARDRLKDNMNPKSEKDRWLRTITSVVTVTVTFRVARLKSASKPRLKELYDFLEGDKHFLEITEIKPTYDYSYNGDASQREAPLVYRITVDLSDGADLVTLLQPLMGWDAQIVVNNISANGPPTQALPSLSELQARIDAAQPRRDLDSDSMYKTVSSMLETALYDSEKAVFLNRPRQVSVEKETVQGTPTSPSVAKWKGYRVGGIDIENEAERKELLKLVADGRISMGELRYKTRAEFDALLEAERRAKASSDTVDKSITSHVEPAAPVPDKERRNRSDLQDVAVQPARDGLRGKREL